MVDDDSLDELWRRFLKDPRTSDAEIRRLSRLALLRYEDFRLQLMRGLSIPRLVRCQTRRP
jgi:hypothetical protein